MGGFRDLMVCDFHRDRGVLEMFVEDVGISKRFFFVQFGNVEDVFFNGSYHDKSPLNHYIFVTCLVFFSNHLKQI